MNWIKHVVDFKNRFLENFFGQSSIHGFPYVVKKETHFIEKLFWIVTILLSVYATFYAFSNQWKRYNENPTVLSIGFLKPSKLNRPAITICAPFYTNETEVVEIIGNIWGVDNSSVSYEIYDNFLHTMSELNYKNMGNLKPFLEHSDKIYNNVINNQTIDLSVISYMLKNSSAIAQPEYNHVITELGLCQSTTKYNSLQNPFYKE
ncbi:CLUMA_CG011580, isoform A [Clunio marinus]|uniref:CLUMA_CG011580, isoform A n=1 Tax=Clunio marinus TaxID=568069 RepID=A0A1J1IID3_9DIPT|nr:CLUMA_CG011580, isoform A [Clunio marinus]